MSPKCPKSGNSAYYLTVALTFRCLPDNWPDVVRIPADDPGHAGWGHHRCRVDLLAVLSHEHFVPIYDLTRDKLAVMSATVNVTSHEKYTHNKNTGNAAKAPYTAL